MASQKGKCTVAEPLDAAVAKRSRAMVGLETGYDQRPQKGHVQRASPKRNVLASVWKLAVALRAKPRLC